MIDERKGRKRKEKERGEERRGEKRREKERRERKEEEKRRKKRREEEEGRRKRRDESKESYNKILGGISWTLLSFPRPDCHQMFSNLLFLEHSDHLMSFGFLQVINIQ